MTFKPLTRLISIPPLTTNPSHSGYTYSQDLVVYTGAGPGSVVSSSNTILWSTAGVLWRYATKRQSEILISRTDDRNGETRSLLLTPGTLRDPDNQESVIITTPPWEVAPTDHVWRITASWILRPQKTITLSCNDYTAYARGSYLIERNKILWNPGEVLEPD